MSDFNPYKSVQGILPTKAEVSMWSADKFLDFFRFYSFFIEDGVTKVTEAKRQSIEEYLSMEFHPYQEFLWRINCFMLNPKATNRMFYNRMSSTLRLLGMYIKEHPTLLIGELRDTIATNPKLVWMIPEEKPPEIVLPETILPTTLAEVGDVTMLSVINKTAGIFNDIVDSIRSKDLKELSVKDKIWAMKALSFVFRETSRVRPSSKAFNQINIFKASKDELESAMNEFVNNDEE